jgi:hypothetical protein
MCIRFKADEILGEEIKLNENFGNEEIIEENFADA